MTCKFTFMRIFALILVVVMLFNCVGFQAFATDSQVIYIEETESNLNDPLVMPEVEISGDPFSFFGILPEISEDREVMWIDRIHNKPQYATDFYNWLVANESSGGALVSAHEQTITENGTSYQVHKVTDYTDEAYFELPKGTTAAKAKTLAREYYEEQIEDDFYTAAEWVSEVYCAFDRDHPEVFWLSGGTIVAHKVKYTIGYDLSACIGYIKYTQDIYFYLHNDDFDIRSSAYCSHSHAGTTKYCDEARIAIKNAITERNNAVNDIVAKSSAKTDLEKVKFINKYLTENNCYNDYSDTNIYSPLAHRSLSALTSKTGIYAPVCDAYAKAFKVLCDKFNIPCVLVDGISNGDEHMWNYVQIDGVWYAVDVTWNDPQISKFVLKSGYETEDYLLVGSDSVINGQKFSDSHIVRDTVIDGGVAFTNEPLISKASYNTKVSHFCTLKNGYCSHCYAKQYDVNRDNEIDIIDMIYLKNSLLDDNKNGNLDCDANGYANGMDLIILKKYFWKK